MSSATPRPFRSFKIQSCMIGIAVIAAACALISWTRPGSARKSRYQRTVEKMVQWAETDSDYIEHEVLRNPGLASKCELKISVNLFEFLYADEEMNRFVFDRASVDLSRRTRSWLMTDGVKLGPHEGSISSEEFAELKAALSKLPTVA